VTLAGWLVVAGSVVMVVMAFSQVADLRSLETREAIEDYLSRPPGEELGISVSRAQFLLQIALMVAAATATATAILGWQVLQRSKGARIALTALAAPLFVTGLASGGIAAAVVTAAIAMLWFQPARDWFDGISRPTAVPRQVPPVPRQAPPAPPSPPVAGRDPLLDLPPPTGPPVHPAPYAAARQPATGVPARRPSAVAWACILTWVSSATTLVVLGVTVAALAADPDMIEDARRQNADLANAGLTDTVLRNAVYATSAVVILWSLVAVLLAVLAWRRSRWAAIALVVSAGLAGGLCLLTLVGSFVLLVPLAACAATVALLLRPEARAWFRR
jgi:hypothetical protein